jgi:hypothetical protein
MIIKYPSDAFKSDLDYPPNCACSLNYEGCRRCRKWSCSIHGQGNRIDIVKPFEQVVPIDAVFVAVLHFGEFRFPSQVSSARTDFLYRLRNDVQPLFWTLHFVQQIPHLNLVFRFNHSMEMHNSKNRGVWREIIQAKFGTELGRNDVYVRPVRNWTKCVRYFYQTNKRLRPDECPPVMGKVKGRRRKSYRLHGESKFIRQLRRDAKLSSLKRGVSLARFGQGQRERSERWK